MHLCRITLVSFPFFSLVRNESLINPDTYIILIASGNYTEQVDISSPIPQSMNLIANKNKVNVTRRGPTYLLGQTTNPNNQSSNTVNIIWAAIAVTGLDNAFTSTLTVAPNLNASLTGSGTTGFAVPAGTPFGCVDFRTYNLNLINDFAPYCSSPPPSQDSNPQVRY